MILETFWRLRFSAEKKVDPLEIIVRINSGHVGYTMWGKFAKNMENYI